jgi:O-antigen/teichoic acid export membrane protein
MGGGLTPVNPGGDPPTIRSRVLRGLAWKAFSQVFRQLSRIAVAVILARLLMPEDYGLAAMVLVFSTLVLVFADLALGAALVQRRELTELDRSTVFWTSTGVGLAFTLLGIALSGPLAAFYGEPEVKPLFAALSVSFLVTSLGTTQTALLNRDMDFRSLELRLMAGTVAGAVVGILLAANGFGAWAIIGQQLAITGVSTMLLWALSPWRPRLKFSLASLRDLGGFSARVFGTRVLFYLNRNADNMLIGRFLGPAALGAYAVAYNVMLAPMSRIARPVVEVLFPAFSRMQDDPKRIASLWLRANRLVAAITVPGMAGLVVVAPEFVRVVLGDHWASAIPVIQILAWVGLMQSLQQLNSSILQARDRTGDLLRYSVIVLVASLTAFAVGLQWGIVGVAAAYAISSTLVEPYYAWLTMRALGLGVGEYLRHLAGVATAALGMVAVVAGLRALLLEEGVPAGASLAILVAAGALTFLPLCAWRAPEVLAELRALRQRRSSSPAIRMTPGKATT